MENAWEDEYSSVGRPPSLDDYITTYYSDKRRGLRDRQVNVIKVEEKEVAKPNDDPLFGSW